MDCVLCKLAALMVWGGFSLCRDHMERVTLARADCNYRAEATEIIEKLRIEPFFIFKSWAT